MARGSPAARARNAAGAGTAPAMLPPGPFGAVIAARKASVHAGDGRRVGAPRTVVRHPGVEPTGAAGASTPHAGVEPAGAAGSSAARAGVEPACAAHAGVARGRVGLAAADLAAPGAGLGAARLDHLPEPLEVALDAAVVRAERGADRLDHALGLMIDLDGDAGLVRAELLEPDHAGVLLAARAAPRDARVGALLRDLGVPLLELAADLGHPVHVDVVELAHLADALHEARELLELRPLVVRGGDGDGEVDRFGDSGHRRSFGRVPTTSRCPRAQTPPPTQRNALAAASCRS